MTKEIALDLLGSFRVRVNGEQLENKQFHLRHSRQLLQMLALQPDLRLTRDLVLETLWPKSDAQAASNRLHHTVHVVRRIFTDAGIQKDEAVVILRAGSVLLNPCHRFAIDLIQFRGLIDQARRDSQSPDQHLDRLQQSLTGAIDLYRGDLLTDSLYEDWLAAYRDEFRLKYMWALDELARLKLSMRQYDSAIALYQKLVDAEPTNELAHRALMDLFDTTGHPNRSIIQYSACKRYLQRDLDAEPSPETSALLESIVAKSRHHKAQLPSLPIGADAGIPDESKRARYHAPPHAVELLGRECDLAILQSLITDKRARLITITGTAGLGKTRLAQVLVERCQDSFKDGAVVVALSGLSSPTQLPGHLALALGVTPSGESISAQLSSYLSERNMLFMLDRFEHLLEAAPFISQLLTVASQVTLLITTQAPLKCCAEHVYELPNLLQNSPLAARDLFIKVAANLGVTIEGEPQNHIIDKICQRVSGNPLAIELAAAQTQLLPLPDILQRLVDQPLKLLNNRMRDAEAHQHGIQEAIEWSYGLLTTELQRTFCLLSVFAGSFTMPMIEQVLGEHLSNDRLQKDVAELIDRHLLQKIVNPAYENEQIKFQILDAPKQFVEERLALLAEHQSVRAAHAKSMALCAGNLLQLLRQGETAEAVKSFVSVIDDLRRALVYAFYDVKSIRCFDFLYKVQALFTAAGMYDEALQWIEHGLKLAPPANSHDLQNDLAWCHMALAMRCRQRLDNAGCIRAMRTARSLAKACSNIPLQIRIEALFANERARQGRFSLAEYHAKRSLDSSEAVDDAIIRVMAKQLVATTSSFQGSFAKSQRYFFEALDDSLATKNPFVIMLSLTGLSGLLLRMGNLTAALENLKQIKVLSQTASNAVSAFANKVCEFLISFEDQDLKRANITLADIESLATTNAGGENQKNIALICRFTLDFELYRSGVQMSLRYWPISIGEVQGEYVYLRVEFLCTRIVWASELDYRVEVQRSYKEISALLRSSRNALWFARLCDATCQVLAKKADVGSCQILLALSKALFDHAGIVPTKRQLAIWDQLHTFLNQYGDENFLAPHPNEMAIVRTSVESRREREKLLLFIKGKLASKEVAKTALAVS